MKALSIKQPCANQILYTGKDIENRSWRTDKRGFVAIHASSQLSTNFGWREEDFSRWVPKSKNRTLLPDAISAIKTSFYVPKDYKKSVVLGAIVGVVEIVECVTEHPSPHFYMGFGERNYGFVLRNPIPLTNPVLVKGGLNFWRVPADAEKQVRDQLKNHSLTFAD